MVTALTGDRDYLEQFLKRKRHDLKQIELVKENLSGKNLKIAEFTSQEIREDIKDIEKSLSSEVA